MSDKKKYEITVANSSQKRFATAETPEKAAILGAKKHHFGFRPVKAEAAAGRPWAYLVSDKAGRVETVYVTVETGEQAEYDERPYAI